LLRFDAVDLVSCRDVTTAEFAAAHPQERLVEGRFRVSALRTETTWPEGMQCMYQFLSPAGQLRIVDYHPKSEQATALAGNVAVEEKQERSSSLGLSVTGDFQRLVQGSAGSDLGSKSASSRRYELKPPLEVVLVSGTLERGTGVYFKLWPSPERGLEGAREFLIVMQVPDTWRGDVLFLRCEAQQSRHGKLHTHAVARFVVGIHAAGDDRARQAAEELVRSEALLRRVVAENRRRIERQALPSLAHKVGALLDIYDPRIPDMWLEELVYGSIRVARQEYLEYLPSDVRRAAEQYLVAKQRMYGLSGERIARHMADAARLPR
jgi:hypothetical protein